MAFWGVEIKPGKSYSHTYNSERGRLRVSQATLGLGKSTDKSSLQCKTGNKRPILLCNLIPNVSETCSLELEFEKDEKVVFSVIGKINVHLSGYYLSGAVDGDDFDSYVEDTPTYDSENSDSYDEEDEEENESDAECIDDSDDDTEMFLLSRQRKSSAFKPPSYNDLKVKILNSKKEQIRQWIEEVKVHWETYGVTIMIDWWKDGKGRTLINFLVNCPKGTIFLKSIDASDCVHDAKLIYQMLKEVIQEVGEKNVVQVCTDNASNYKLAGYWLMEDTKIYWMPCAAHCLNLVLQDVAEWWVTFGSEVPALQRFAKRVLGLTSAASPCERNWSTFSDLHTKKRNCLEHERLCDLAYIQYNMRLKKHLEERINGKENDPIVSKSIDECAQWLIPHDADDVLGEDGLTFGLHEDVEEEYDDRPITRQSHRNTSTMQQDSSSSRVPPSPNNSYDDDDDDDDESDGDENYSDGEEFGDSDGIDSDDEDL